MEIIRIGSLEPERAIQDSVLVYSGGGNICPTITAESGLICKIEKGGDVNGQHEHRV